MNTNKTRKAKVLLPKENRKHALCAAMLFIGAALAALFGATKAFVPNAFAQSIAHGSPQHAAAMVELPGFPGTPRIYHLGATGFFLDHNETIRLTPAQQKTLDGIKTKSISSQGVAHGTIDQAEQELWALTGSDQPDAMAIETKIREIERLKGDRRIAFIRSVGEAARLLTDEQRTALRGARAAGSAPATDSRSPGDSVDPNAGMIAMNPTAPTPGMAGGPTSGMGGGRPPNSPDAPADAGHAGHHPRGGAAGAPDAQGMTPGASMTGPAAPADAPGMGASAPMAAPGTPPAAPAAAGMAGGGMDDMMGKMMGPAAGGGCMGAGCGSGAALMPIYASLMTLPALTPEKRAEIDALASQQISEGMERLTAGVESIQRATQIGDDALAQQSVGTMREGLDELGAGIAARRVLSEGKAPRNLALDWFKREMNLASPVAREHARTPLGVQPFHLFTMVLLVAFALAMITMYFFKMRRAAALFGRIEADKESPPPGSSPPLAGGKPPDGDEPPSGDRGASGERNPPSGGGPPPSAPSSNNAEDARPPAEGAATTSAVSGTTSRPPLTKNWKGQLRVGSVVAEAPGVKTFRLLPSSNDRLLPIQFVPGQFLNVAFSIGGARMNRSYSISSSPNQREYLDLTIKREPRGAVSRHIVDLITVGDLIEASGPVGKFTFSGTEAQSIVLIAAGVGITPMVSITRYLTERSWPGDIFFIYTCRTPADFILGAEIDALARQNPRLHVAVTITKAEGTGWKGLRGRITKELLTQTVPNIITRRIHVCGPPAMMEATKAILAQLGVPPEQVKSEQFGATRPRPGAGGTTAKLTAPATGPLVTFSRSNKSSRIHTDQTVLELSEELAIGIENSCRVGTCGVCKVKMTFGEVEMLIDDALDEDDKANGIILACQAKPMSEIAVEA